jgi:hypothetical protein
MLEMLRCGCVAFFPTIQRALAVKTNTVVITVRCGFIVETSSGKLIQY